MEGEKGLLLVFVQEQSRQAKEQDEEREKQEGM